VASTDQTGIRIHQFAPAEIDTVLADGSALRLRIATGYPVDGRVEVTVLAAPEREWSLSFRVPGWAGDVALEGPGEVERSDGRIGIRGAIPAGETVVLTLPVEPRITRPDRRIDAVRGCVAVEAGPLVYCLESVDAPAGADLAETSIPADIVPVRGEGDVLTVPVSFGAAASPTNLIPYHRWAERGSSTMRVWLPVQPDLTTPEGEEAHS
jgi:DUF1680 family protein